MTTPSSENETEDQRQVRHDRQFAEFLQRQEQQQEHALEHPDTLPLQARVPSDFQPRPSAGEAFASDFWDDLTGGYGYYGFGGYGHASEGGSRPPGAPRSEDEDDGGQDDDVDEE